MTLTQERLKEVLHYCPDLGLFWWKVRSISSSHDKTFNKHFAGKIAGKLATNGYVRISVDGRDHAAHRLAWLYMTGVTPADDIDHRNGRKLDNAFENLREATRSQNLANRSQRNATGFKGVTRLASGRFTAEIRKNRVKDYLGSFDTAEEAHAAYEARASQVHGEFARAA